MLSAVPVLIHPSQFPDCVRQDLIDSLRTRRINHKFHYDGIRQTQKWLALHEACSPARTAADCRAVYDQAFSSAAQRLHGARLHLVGLGCGGGQKDARCLQILAAPEGSITYTPVDVSTAMVLVALQAAAPLIGSANCRPLVCDLLKADDLATCLAERRERAPRLITFFGMIPNFEPGLILPRLRGLIRPGDLLLFSANLIPGSDPASGLRSILPQYDNPLTRDWLMAFLLDVGIEQGDGHISCSIEEDPAAKGIHRIVADFVLSKSRLVTVDHERFDFAISDRIRLFFSYRYTPMQIRTLLERHGLEVRQEWIADSNEEGVFLCGGR